MAEVGQKDHRKRLREAYLANPDAEMTDRAMLELLLTYAIPRKDVKPYVYELLNEYKTLDNIFNSDIAELQNINGLGESSAIMLQLVGKIAKTLEKQSQANEIRLNSSSKAIIYVREQIAYEKNERFLVITLDSFGKLINCHSISTGDQLHIELDKQKLFRKILNDDAKGVILAHNHPNSKAYPSTQDVNTTVEVLNILRKLGIALKDHIIVNENETYCMSSDLIHAEYFD